MPKLPEIIIPKEVRIIKLNNGERYTIEITFDDDEKKVYTFDKWDLSNARSYVDLHMFMLKFQNLKGRKSKDE